MCDRKMQFGDSGNRPHYLLFSNSPVGTIKWEILPLFCAAVIWIGEVLTKGLILSKRSLTFLIAKLSCIQITRTYSRTHSKILVRFLINVNLMCVVELYICHGRISIGERPWQPAMGMDCFLSQSELINVLVLISSECSRWCQCWPPVGRQGVRSFLSSSRSHVLLLFGSRE